MRLYNFCNAEPAETVHALNPTTHTLCFLLPCGISRKCVPVEYRVPYAYDSGSRILNPYARNAPRDPRVARPPMVCRVWCTAC